MRYVTVVLASCVCVLPTACKRARPPRPAPEGGRVSVPQTVPPLTAPTTTPASRPADARLDEEQLLRFIASSGRVAALAFSSGLPVEPSPRGFSAMESFAIENADARAAIAKAGMDLRAWATTGQWAWSAWSIAQSDYNAEAPLRENQVRLADARLCLASAQASGNTGVRLMSAEERQQRASAARDAATDAADRAQAWADKAASLREQITAAELALGGSASSRDPGFGPGGPGSSVHAVPSGLTQELAAAERNERQERQNASRFKESAQHPELPIDPAGKADLVRDSQARIEQSQARITRLGDEEKLLQAHLREDRRINADSRKKAASEADIALLRKHLAEFNTVWGMAADGGPPANPNNAK